MNTGVFVLDVGNTTAAGALARGIRLRGVTRAATASLKRSPAKFLRTLARKGRGNRLLVASVVPALDASLSRAARAVLGVSAEFVRAESLRAMTVRTVRPAEVGADRVVNALAARRLYGCPVIVVDFGTATTFDVVDARGAYLGGAILPGVDTALEALHRSTAKIPRIAMRRPRRVVGRSTQEAVRSGVYHGTLGEVREIAFRIRKELGVVAPLVATGGWCRLFRGEDVFAAADPYLTLKGLALLVEDPRAGH